MVQKRFESDEIVGPELLAETLHFKTSGRTARNRILKSSLTEMISTFDLSDPKKSGLPTQRLINLYEKFGHGEYGVLLTGNMAVDPWHLEAAGNCIISKEGDTEERRQLLKRLSEAAKLDGALALVQLVHAGRQTATRVNKTPFSASDVQLEGDLRGHKYGKPIPLSLEQIKTEVVDRYVFAAKQVRDAGFDGIQIHGAHGYLLAQFLSPRTNRRTDKYGGNVENRVRVVAEIYNAIRAEIPASTGFIIGIKVNSVEFQEDGNKTDDAIEIAKALDALGLDFIELSGGNYEKFEFYHAKESTKKREAFFSEFALAIKPHIRNAVVYLTGGFRTVPAMVRAIQQNETDGIGLGRPVTIEPDLPKKLLSGQVTGAAFSHYEHVFDVSMHISLTQMAQAGLTNWEEAGHDPCFGIPDFSNKADADKFSDALAVFLNAYESNLQKGRDVTGIFEYPPRVVENVELAKNGLTGAQLEKVQA